MKKDVTKDIKSRLVYLFTGEFFAVVVFTSLYFNYFSSSQSYSLIYALFILNLILLQGGFYWFICWERLKNKRTILPNLYKPFIIFKKINFALICIMPLMLILDIVVLEQIPITFLLTAFIYIFAIIEYVNYFYVQLTNYKNGRGKKSSIAKEIDKKQRKK